MSQKLIDLKNRMRSVQNIQNITKTVATVAAAKLARTRYKAVGLRTYSQKMREIIFAQTRYVEQFGEKIEKYSPLMQEKEKIENLVCLVIASDIGMCGNYNRNICRLAQDFAEKKQKEEKKNVFLVTKGFKVEEYFRKRTKLPIIHQYRWRTEGVSLKDAEELLALILNLYSTQGIEEIHCFYTQFHSPVKQEPERLRLLPLRMEFEEETKAPPFEAWIYEPALIPILEELVPTYLRVQVYDLLLESYASEQSARMMAMEEASERAENTLHQLRIHYNKMRRELVTLDLLGIISAGKVLEKEALARVGF